ncbi:MAG: prepilin-type N-terminal cleavage/methylation domain-containing protein [Aliidiomarina sp.]|uniref:PulJ/GspJ family protein n=1 Tax=Aliidiomarina sp. TaxID=1872439 RepID=UPI0025C179D3|nr:prepilin-type N-terminal cleavage/methylation domain-containing protein [Aliidiomarina sp.]MCH8502235.1 prepilin-type N-terminal cleavage/methylation domain-containing protein [Aliidiomarina sp.]
MKAHGFTLPEVMLASALLATTVVFLLTVLIESQRVWRFVQTQYKADMEIQLWLSHWQQQPPQQHQTGELSGGLRWQILPSDGLWSWRVDDVDGERIEQGWYTPSGAVLEIP